MYNIQNDYFLLIYPKNYSGLSGSMNLIFLIDKSKFIFKLYTRQIEYIKNEQICILKQQGSSTDRNGSLNFTNIQGHIYYKILDDLNVNIGVINTRTVWCHSHSLTVSHCKTSAGADWLASARHPPGHQIWNSRSLNSPRRMKLIFLILETGNMET